MDLRTTLSLDTSQHDSAIDSAASKVRTYDKAAEDASKSVEGLTNASSKSARALLQQMSSIENLSRSTSSYRRQLVQLTRELQDLTINYNKMTADQKNSDFGKEVLAKMREMEAEAAKLKDELGDVSQEISKMSSDTSNWDAMKEAIDVTSSSLQGLVGVMGLSETQTDKLVKVIAKLQAIEAATNAVIKIGNTFNKSSIAIKTIQTLQTKALAAAENLKTAATVKGTVATKGATIAQAAFNAVAKANPYVLLATAIIGVVGALAAFTTTSKKSAEEEKKAQKEAEALKKKQEELRHECDTLGTKTGDLVGSFRVLQTQWRNLKSEAEKKEWIKANKTEFNKLGVEVNNVNDAYNVFVKNAPKVIAALKAIAEAEAFKDLYKESITKREKEWNQRSKSRDTGDYYSKYDTSTEEVGVTAQQALNKNKEWQNAGIGLSDIEYSRACGQVTGYYKLNQQGIDKINQYRNSQALALNAKIKKTYDDEVDHYASSYDEAIKKAEKAKAELAATGVKTTNGNSPTTNNTTKNVEKGEVGSLFELQKAQQELEDKLKKMSPNNPKFAETKKRLEEMTALVEKIKKEMESVKPMTETESLIKSYDDAAKEVQNIVKQYNIGIIDETEAKRQIASINAELQKLKLKPIKVDLKVEENETISKYQSLVKKIKEVVENYDIGLIDKEDAEKQIADLNRQIQEMGLKPVKVQLEFDAPSGSIAGIQKQISDIQARIEIETDPAKIRELGKELSKLNKQLEDTEKLAKDITFDDWTQSVGGFVHGLDGAVSSWDGFISAVDEGKNAWEVFMTLFDAVTSTIEAFKAITEAVEFFQTAMGIANTVTAANTVAQEVNTQTEVAGIAEVAAAKAAAIPATLASSVANQIATATENTAAYASIPFAGPGLAAAAQAAYTALWASAMIPMFADGGIFTGATTIGDYNIARVNKGEMILNNRQQGNLFDILDKGINTNTGPTTSTVRIKGNDIYLSMKNTAKTKGLVGKNIGIK